MYRFDLAYTNIVFNARDCEVRVDYLYMAWVSAKRARRRFPEDMILGARARASHPLAQAARRTGTDSQLCTADGDGFAAAASAFVYRQTCSCEARSSLHEGAV